MGKVTCVLCNKACKDQALKLGERYFHTECFKCKQCQCSLSANCFYTQSDDLYCSEDYHRLFGTKCHICGEVVEGEVVTALGNTYHDECFRCTLCQKKLAPGEKVTFTGAKVSLCSSCCDVQLSVDGHISKTTCYDQESKQPNRESSGSRCGSRCEVDYSRFYNTSYLDKTADFKRGPSINPCGEPSPKHYHRPENFSYSSVRRDFIVPAKRETSLLTTTGVTTTDGCDVTNTSKSPRHDLYHSVTNHEPVRLSKFPDAHRASRQERDIAESTSDANDTNSKDVDEVDANTDCEVEELMSRQRSDLQSKSFYDMGRPRPKSGSRLETSSYYNLVSSGSGVEFDPTTGLRNTRLRSVYLCDGFISPYLRHRRSLPVLIRAEEPAKIYPYEDLLVSNFTLPPGVERMNVEKHLSKEDFERLFHMSRDEFYHLAEWKRNDLKLKVGLF